MEKMIQLPLWHFKTIENALRLTNNVCNCHTKETAFDREVTKAYEYAKRALANVNTGLGQSNIPDVSGSDCSECGGKLTHNKEYDVHPYGDNIEYDKCEKCGRKFSLKCF